MKIAIGDIVQLKSGGMEMTVKGVGPTHVECVWQTKDGAVQQVSLPMDCVVMAKR